MPVLSWYWNRLRAMEPGEVSGHIRRKLWQLRNSEPPGWHGPTFAEPGPFPSLPDSAAAPKSLRDALHTEAKDILTGHWSVWGGMSLQVDDPPRWQKDYLSGIEIATRRPARQLNHRELPHGADIKLVWELSRWNQLVRLAQAGYVLKDEHAASKCVEWVKDWVKHNPPFRGWNWTSALESGLRLIQFSWIDAMLCKLPSLAADLAALRQAILPAHAQFTWRCRTFGSSANNHLLGELAGLIVAIVRWPALEQCVATLDRLQTDWEGEVFAQFWEDGGNKEQALNYQSFSWELCWMARLALLAASRPISGQVEARLERAARFYNEVQAPAEPWDYGDSDNAYVTPLFTDERSALQEWRAWMIEAPKKTAYGFWLGAAPELHTASQPVAAGEWRRYPNSGIATCRSEAWFLRWDLSPLGYLKPAAHGHFDALHLSIWYKDIALIIDPGTGAYYGDPALRAWLASRQAHNGPCVDSAEQPKRLGPFLWSHHHQPPEWRSSGNALNGELLLGTDRLRRSIAHIKYGVPAPVVSTAGQPAAPAKAGTPCLAGPEVRSDRNDGWLVADAFEPGDNSPRIFTVRWQFAPGTVIKPLSERRFQASRRDASIIIEVDTAWTDVRLVGREADRDSTEPPLAGFASPSFRRTVFAPYLRLTARCEDKPCVFTTTFLACEVR